MVSHDEGAPLADRWALLRPLLVALGVTLALQCGVQLYQIGFGLFNQVGYKPPYPFAQMPLTHSDFGMLAGAHAAYLSGAPDFDAVQREARERDGWKRKYPYPPLAYRLLAGINVFPGLSAHFLWIFATLALVTLSVAVFAHHVLTPLGAAREPGLVLVLFILSQSTPLLFQIERGNFDWVALSLCLLALVAAARNRPWSGGALLGVAVALKVYPVLLLPVLLLARRERAVVAALATLLLLILVLGPADHLQWLRFMTSDRAQSFGAHPWNVSLANLFRAFGLAEGDTLIRTANVVFIALFTAFAGLVYWHARRRPLDVARVGAFTLPFMFLVPPVHWGYTLFVLPAVLAVLPAMRRERAPLALPITLMAVAIGITQAPITAPRFHPAMLPWVMPIYALALLTIVVCALWLLARGACAAPAAPSEVSG